MKIQPPLAKLDDKGILALKKDDDQYMGWIVIGVLIAAAVLYLIIDHAKKN